MTPSADLFGLIKSLTKQEKIFFKTNCSVKRESEKVYMALYNAIDMQKKYDEGKIKKQLGKAVDARSFPVIKNYLFHLILDTLCSYYPDGLPDFMVQRMIEKAKIMNNK